MARGAGVSLEPRAYACLLSTFFPQPRLSPQLRTGRMQCRPRTTAQLQRRVQTQGVSCVCLRGLGRAAARTDTHVPARPLLPATDLLLPSQPSLRLFHSKVFSTRHVVDTYPALCRPDRRLECVSSHSVSPSRPSKADLRRPFASSISAQSLRTPGSRKDWLPDSAVRSSCLHPRRDHGRR